MPDQSPTYDFLKMYIGALQNKEDSANKEKLLGKEYELRKGLMGEEYGQKERLMRLKDELVPVEKQAASKLFQRREQLQEELNGQLDQAILSGDPEKIKAIKKGQKDLEYLQQVLTDRYEEAEAKRTKRALDNQAQEALVRERGARASMFEKFAPEEKAARIAETKARINKLDADTKRILQKTEEGGGSSFEKQFSKAFQKTYSYEDALRAVGPLAKSPEAKAFVQAQMKNVAKENAGRLKQLQKKDPALATAFLQAIYEDIMRGTPFMGSQMDEPEDTTDDADTEE